MAAPLTILSPDVGSPARIQRESLEGQLAQARRTTATVAVERDNAQALLRTAQKQLERSTGIIATLQAENDRLHTGHALTFLGGFLLTAAVALLMWSLR